RKDRLEACPTLRSGPGYWLLRQMVLSVPQGTQTEFGLQPFQNQRTRPVANRRIFPHRFVQSRFHSCGGISVSCNAGGTGVPPVSFWFGANGRDARASSRPCALQETGMRPTAVSAPIAACRGSWLD